MAPNLERREKSEQIVLRRRTLKLNAGHWHTASILDIRGNDWMTHFNGEGIVRMREKLAKLESRHERDLLHRFPPLLVVFSFQTFSEFISYAIFFFKKHLFRKSRARSHIKQKFLTAAKCFAGGQNSFGFIICLNTDIFIVVNSTFYRNYCEKNPWKAKTDFIDFVRMQNNALPRTILYIVLCSVSLQTPWVMYGALPLAKI